MMVIRVPTSTRTYGSLNGRSVTQRSGATFRGDRSMLPILRVDDPIRLMTDFGIWRGITSPAVAFEAKRTCTVVWLRPLADDPSATSARNFCCDAQRRSGATVW